MFARLNGRNQIVEATDTEQGGEYVEISGTVAVNMPDGLLGFNGKVYTPNYVVAEGAVVARTEEDKARDPYSDSGESEVEDMQNALNMLGVNP